MHLSEDSRAIRKVAWQRMIAFLIGRHQYNICRPYLFSVFLNHLLFYFFLILSATTYLYPNQFFVKIILSEHLFRFFIVITVVQFALLLLGAGFAVALHVSLTKGNTNYPLARGKRAVFYLLTSISLVYVYGSSFIFARAIMFRDYLLMALQLGLFFLTLVYFVLFSYISIFYAGTTILLTPMQYFLSEIIPHVMAFLLGPFCFYFIQFIKGISNWLAAGRFLHMSFLILTIYHMCLHLLLPFCAILTPLVIFFGGLMSGINLVGIFMTIIPTPAMHFVVYLSVIICWTIAVFSICFNFVTHKYKKEYTAMARLHNGTYIYTTTYFTPEVLYNNLLVLTAYTRRAATTNNQLHIALENICLCYIIALYKSLELDSDIKRFEIRKMRFGPITIRVLQRGHIKSCIAKCSKQKRLAYISLILDLLDCEVLQTSLNMQETISNRAFPNTNTALHQDRRIIYEVNLYLLETFISLMILKSMGHSLTDKTFQRGCNLPNVSPGAAIAQASVRNHCISRTHNDIAGSSALLKAHQNNLNQGPSYAAAINHLETIDSSNTYNRGPINPHVNEFNSYLKLSNNHGHKTEHKSIPFTSPGKESENQHRTNSNRLSYSFLGDKSVLPLRIYRYSSDRMTIQPTSRKSLRNLWMDWLFSDQRTFRSCKTTLTGSLHATTNYWVEFRGILNRLSPDFLLDVVFTPRQKLSDSSQSCRVNDLLAFLIYSCCGCVLDTVMSKKSKTSQLRQIFDPCKIFYLDDSLPQTIYTQPEAPPTESSTGTAVAQSVIIASPYTSPKKDIGDIFNEYLNSYLKSSRMRTLQLRKNKRTTEFIMPKVLIAGEVTDGTLSNLYKSFLRFAPPSKYRYFVNPRLANTRPMNLCACTIINSILSRILEDADTCLTNINRITKLSNNLKRDRNFSTTRLEELMLLCSKQNTMYQDMVEQAKKLYLMYPYCVTATHTLAWVYHELYNTIWPLNQLSIFPLIDHLHPSLTSRDLSTLHNSLIIPASLVRKKSCNKLPTAVDTESMHNFSNDSSTDSPTDLAIICSDMDDNDCDATIDVDDNLIFKSPKYSQDYFLCPHQTDSETATKYSKFVESTAFLAGLKQTYNNPTIPNASSNSRVLPLNNPVQRDSFIQEYIQKFILHQDLSTQSFYIAHNSEGSIVILPPCLSYCHYAIIDSSMHLQRCEYKTHSDIMGATSLWSSPDIPVNILDRTTMLSAIHKRLTVKNTNPGLAKLRTFFTTGFAASMRSHKVAARKFVTTLLNRHQDIIRPITIFSTESVIYVLGACVAFTLGLFVLFQSTRIFEYNDRILESTSAFNALFQTDEKKFMKLYDKYSARKASGQAISMLFTIDDLISLYNLSISASYGRLSQKIYKLRLNLEQYTFSSIHPFFHILKASNRMVSFVPGPVPARIYGTILFQNPYERLLQCFPIQKTLAVIPDLTTEEAFLKTVDCMHQRIEEVHENIYVNIAPLLWNNMFATASSFLLIQNFSTHLKVLLLVLTVIMGIFLIFAFSSYNVFLLRLQNLCDILLNLLSRTGARFDYRLLFAQFYFNQRLSFGSQNVKYVPTFEHLMALHPDVMSEEDEQADGDILKESSNSLVTAQQVHTALTIDDIKRTIPTIHPLVTQSIALNSNKLARAVLKDNLPGNYSNRAINAKPANRKTASSFSNLQGKSAYKYDYNRLVEMYNRCSQHFDKVTMIGLISKGFIIVCIAISIAIIYIFHSFPIASYTDTGFGPYYASVIEKTRYSKTPTNLYLDANEPVIPDNFLMPKTISDIVRFERCLTRTSNFTEKENCKNNYVLSDELQRIRYASPQWRLTWLRQNYALLQDLILDNLLVDLSISQHAGLTTAQPTTVSHTIYNTCSRAIKNPHLAPFKFDMDIRLSTVTEKLIYLYTMSLRGSTYDYYSAVLNRYCNIAGKYVRFVRDYATASNPPVTFKEQDYKAALLLSPLTANLFSFNQLDLQKTVVGIRAFTELQKTIYNSFSILQPSYTKLRGESPCAELQAIHGALLMNSIVDQRDSTTVNKDVDKENVTLEHIWSLLLFLGFVPITLYFIQNKKMFWFNFFDKEHSVWVDLYSHKVLSIIYFIVASLLSAVIGMVTIISFTRFFIKKLAVLHMTRVYLSSSYINNLGLQLLDSLGQYNMQLASLEWDNTAQTYNYKCDDVYVALQRPIMLNTQFHLTDSVHEVGLFVDVEQMLKSYYELRHAMFSVNIALARMCKLPAKLFPASSTDYGADAYLDEMFKFSVPQPNKRYSSYYEDYSLCTDSNECVDVYSYKKLKTLTNKQIHAYIKEISKGSDILLKRLLNFSFTLETMIVELARQILFVEYRINDFMVLTQRLVSWLLVIHVVLQTLFYVYIQAASARNGLVAFKIMTTHRFTLAFRFGVTVGAFIILVVVLFISLLLAFFQTDINTTNRNRKMISIELYNPSGTAFFNCHLTKVILSAMHNTDITYDEIQLSELYTRVQILDEYAKLAYSSAQMLIPGFIYTNSTGSYDIKDILLDYTENILNSVKYVRGELQAKANKFDQRISLSQIYKKPDYLGITQLSPTELDSILKGYITPPLETRNFKVSWIVVQSIMISAFLGGTIYILVSVRKEISSILTIFNTIPVTDLFSFEEMSSGIFKVYGDILSFTKLM